MGGICYGDKRVTTSWDDIVAAVMQTAKGNLDHPEGIERIYLITLADVRARARMIALGVVLKPPDKPPQWRSKSKSQPLWLHPSSQQSHRTHAAPVTL